MDILFDEDVCFVVLYTLCKSFGVLLCQRFGLDLLKTGRRGERGDHCKLACVYVCYERPLHSPPGCAAPRHDSNQSCMFILIEVMAQLLGRAAPAT